MDILKSEPDSVTHKELRWQWHDGNELDKARIILQLVHNPHPTLKDVWATWKPYVFRDFVFDEGVMKWMALDNGFDIAIRVGEQVRLDELPTMQVIAYGAWQEILVLRTIAACAAEVMRKV